MENNITCKCNQKIDRVAILLLDKIEFKSKTVKGERHTLYIDKRVNSSKIYNNYKLCTKQPNSKICETNIARIEGRNRQLYILELKGDNSWGVNTLPSITDTTDRTSGNDSGRFILHILGCCQGI